MFKPLVLGSIVILANMGIQCLVVVTLIRFLIKRDIKKVRNATYLSDIKIIFTVLGVLFAGHVVQFAVWAQLFILIGEFSDFTTAFYHSIVNFASLGYGDIVMSKSWKLLGALEACNGVLMLGLSAGTLLAIMTQLFKRYDPDAQAPEDVN